MEPTHVYSRRGGARLGAWYGGGPGVRLFFRGRHWEESVDFYSMTAWREVLAELRSAGFNVVERPAS